MNKKTNNEIWLNHQQSELYGFYLGVWKLMIHQWVTPFKAILMGKTIWKTAWIQGAQSENIAHDSMIDSNSIDVYLLPYITRLTVSSDKSFSIGQPPRNHHKPDVFNWICQVSARACELGIDSDLTWAHARCSTSQQHILPPSHRLRSCRLLRPHWTTPEFEWLAGSTIKYYKILSESPMIEKAPGGGSFEFPSPAANLFWWISFHP